MVVAHLEAVRGAGLHHQRVPRRHRADDSIQTFFDNCPSDDSFARICA